MIALESYTATGSIGNQLNQVPIVGGDDALCAATVEAVRSGLADGSSIPELRALVNGVSRDHLAALLARTSAVGKVRMLRISRGTNPGNSEHQVIEKYLRNGEYLESRTLVDLAGKPTADELART